MDRLLAWDDLEPRAEGTEAVTAPPELRDEVRARSDAFVMQTGETFDAPLLLLEFTAYMGAGTMRSIVVRESDLHGTIGENLDSINATAPADSRPDLLVRRGTL